MTPRGPLRRLLPLLGVAVAVIWFGASAMQASARGRSADIVRQWTVSQYVLARTDPYAFALDVLEAHYGPFRRSHAEVFVIPREVPPARTSDLLPGLGPPEATYPPSAAAMVVGLVGWLSTPSVVIRVWWAINVGLLLVVITWLWRWLPVAPGGRRARPWHFVVCAFAFTPFFMAFSASQFSLLVLAALLVALEPEVTGVRAGLAFAVALIKPSITLPFAAVLVARRQWRAVGIVVCVQAVLVLVIWALVGSTPLAMHTRWLQVSQYFLQSMYSIQELVNAAGLAPFSGAVSLALLLTSAGLMIWCRAAHPIELFVFAAAVSLYWTYHGSYDFVAILPALLVYMGWRPRADQRFPEVPFARGFVILGLVVFVTLSVASLPVVYGGDDVVTRSVRWLARIVSLALFASAFVRILLARRAAVEGRNGWSPRVAPADAARG